MKIDNGRMVRLEIDGVFEGAAGVSGRFVSFVPNRSDRSPREARAGVLDGRAVRLIAVVKDEAGPFWTAEWAVLS